MAKKNGVKIPEVVEAEPANGELAITMADGSILRRWFSGLERFFSEALRLEGQARESLARAQHWTLPTTKLEDETLVHKVRLANADKHAIEKHWEITQAVHRFHRRLTQARERGIALLEDAVAIGNRLHNTYAEAERLRAREEEDRLRRELEERQRQERERELLELDRKAAEAEEASVELSQREQEYLAAWFRNGGNATTAAKAAGYKDPIAAAARLTTSPKIRAAIKARQDAELLRRQAEAKRAAPLDVEHVQVKAEVAKGDVSRWSGEVLDEGAFIAAVIGGKHGIPWDVLTVNQPKLNDYARSLNEVLDRWPGVRAKKSTTIR